MGGHPGRRPEEAPKGTRNKMSCLCDVGFDGSRKQLHDINGLCKEGCLINYCLRARHLWTGAPLFTAGRRLLSSVYGRYCERSSCSANVWSHCSHCLVRMTSEL